MYEYSTKVKYREGAVDFLNGYDLEKRREENVDSLNPLLKFFERHKQ